MYWQFLIGWFGGIAATATIEGMGWGRSWNWKSYGVMLAVSSLCMLLITWLDV